MCSVKAKLKTGLKVDAMHTHWAAELQQLSVVQLGSPAGVPNQAFNKIKREKVEARTGYRRHPVWPNTNKPWLLSALCFVRAVLTVCNIHLLHFLLVTSA